MTVTLTQNQKRRILYANALQSKDWYAWLKPRVPKLPNGTERCFVSLAPMSYTSFTNYCDRIKKERGMHFYETLTMTDRLFDWHNVVCGLRSEYL